DEKFWISSESDPVNWLDEASKYRKVTDVHPDRLLRKPEKDKAIKPQRFPKYLGIPSNLFQERSSSTSALLVNGNNQLVRFPNSEGMVPLKSFSPRANLACKISTVQRKAYYMGLVVAADSIPVTTITGCSFFFSGCPCTEKAIRVVNV
ncbi:hypothetical protein M8C21_002393, partial [Ambrosia artemisiifolia]